MLQQDNMMHPAFSNKSHPCNVSNDLQKQYIVGRHERNEARQIAFLSVY